MPAVVFHAQVKVRLRCPVVGDGMFALIYRMRFFVRISRFFPSALFSLFIFFAAVTCPASEIEVSTTPDRAAIAGIEEAVGLMDAGLLCQAEKKLAALAAEDADQSGMISFLRGRIYSELGPPEKAEEYLLKSAEKYPLLKDYAFKTLADMYAGAGEHEKVIAAVSEISSRLLLKYSLQSRIASLSALGRQGDLREAYSTYTEKFPDDWRYKMDFALVLAGAGDTDGAIVQYKDVYLGGGRLAEDALDALQSLHADSFSVEETVKRADNLFTQYRYAEAEPVYEKMLAALEGDEKARVMFAVGMCQFRQKRYGESARSFSMSAEPEWMYWRARSFYRINNSEGFSGVKKDLEKNYPGDGRLALLYLMEADEMRRQGNLHEAEKGYETVASRFPDSAEEALWGLGWMHYSAGNFEKSLEYFSRLGAFKGSGDYHKYLYWKARAQERVGRGCPDVNEKNSSGAESGCGDVKPDFFQDLPADRSYYGYMIKMRAASDETQGTADALSPALPDGEQYQRIHALTVMGMRNEAVEEITGAVKRAHSPDELLYLGHTAMKLNAYKEVIAIAEPRDEREFLPYAYPRAYWDTIKDAAGGAGIDEHLVAALIREESRYDPDVVSWAGAVGLMQLLPATAKRVNRGVMVHTGGMLSLDDARTNILLGTHYFSRLVEEFREIPLAVAAYNAGENALRRWLAKYYKEDMAEFIENIPYQETRRYVQKVLKSYWQYRSLSGLPIAGIGGPEPGNRDYNSGLAKAAVDP